MLLDAKLTFSDAQAETTVAAHDSTNVVDLDAAGNAIDPLELVVRVDTAVTSEGAATVQFKLETCATVDGSYEVLWASDAIGKATLVKGYEIKVPLPRTGVKRFLKVTYTPAVDALTAGKFDAFLVPATQVAL